MKNPQLAKNHRLQSYLIHCLFAYRIRYTIQSAKKIAYGKNLDGVTIRSLLFYCLFIATHCFRREDGIPPR